MNHHPTNPTRRSPRVGRLRPAAALLLAVAGLGTACSLPGAAPGTGGAPPPAEAAAPTTRPADIGEPAASRAIVITDEVEVRDRPGGEVTATLSNRTDFGSTRVLLVEDRRDDWVQIRLPLRPNHQTGWVPASAVTVEELDVTVEISLSERTLAVVENGRTVLETPVAVGAGDNPTPPGTFFVTDKLESPSPDGAYGPYALGLSGYSDTLTEFAGGNGQIGLHGTNDPDSIGRAVSHGCIRVPNSVISELAQRLPLGTPVIIGTDADRGA
ncbi:MAG: L,D-transpeptidase family protein [Acidimicrobiales bacterium]